ncbi:UDP-glucose 4-epimerase GalE [Virgisporangium ochraceum]|uniref:UDP-glucose 4-epimerase n=1 Tax=Virgisporangium ochraceum TaxID=65505 RepID=A0A8J3ZKW8_9ACTN|nr:UDP-glucose 4-epimerase GalE [Virgisporangium ochraceum]GIJ65759.1 UDP-glucose 4-epimerase GalE [Virgisporangium ochraceum]
MKVLVTGGAGYIGSTVCSALLDRGIQPVILDNLVTGREQFTEGRVFYRGDIADGALVDEIFAAHPETGVAIHCAALIVVPESVDNPLRYYRENVSKTVDLLEHLRRNGCERVLFSSSASMYKPGEDFAVDESAAIEPTSPYARTKFMVEGILGDVAGAGQLRAISLRYFNPIGADPKMRTGLQTRNPSHALGRMIVAWEAGETFTITGVDWPTRDGTGIRDYIHVWDLALAHVQAVVRFDEILPEPGYRAINLGTGNGTTVRELVAAFNAVIGGELPVAEAPPRLGDAAGAFTRSSRAATLLEWAAEFSIEDGIRHSLEWRTLDNERA